jgi:hypothetical protein
LISCDLQFDIFLKTSRAFFFYNPYSIVKEAQVAKTNAERNLVDCVHRLSRGDFAIRSLRNLHNQKRGTGISAQPFARAQWRRGRTEGLCGWMVELIGIEPTTLCLQSRCSPS